MRASRFTVHLDEAAATLHVSGDVEEDDIDAFREALRAASQDYRVALVVDLSAITYLPSLGVGVLAVALRHAARHRSDLSLVAPQGSVAQRVLDMCVMPLSAAALRDLPEAGGIAPALD